MEQAPADPRRKPPAWYLCHHDGKQYGPYPLEKLVEGAKLGRIAEDTRIRHPVLTQNHWVFAVTIPAISHLCTPAPPRVDSAKEPIRIVTRRSQPRPKYLRWSWAVPRTVFGLLFVATWAIAYQRHEQIAQLLQLAQESPERTAVASAPAEPKHTDSVETTPGSAPDADRVRSPGQYPEAKSSTPPHQPAPRPLRVAETKGEETTHAAAEQTIELDIDLSSSRRVSRLTDVAPGSEVYLEDVRYAPVRPAMAFEERPLSKDDVTRVEFRDLGGLALELRIVEQPEADNLLLAQAWRFPTKPGVESAFSLRRLKSREKVLRQRVNAATAALQQAAQQRGQLELFVNSKGIKRLDDVNAAKNRIRLIDSRLPGLRSTVQREQRFLQEWKAFSSAIRPIDEQARLVLRMAAMPQEAEN